MLRQRSRSRVQSLQHALRVAPTAQIPHRSSRRRPVGRTKFASAQFARSQRQGVIIPRRVAKQGAGVFVVAGLSQRTVYDAPSAAHRFPARQTARKIARQQRFSVSLDANTFELGLSSVEPTATRPDTKTIAATRSKTIAANFDMGSRTVTTKTWHAAGKKSRAASKRPSFSSRPEKRGRLMAFLRRQAQIPSIPAAFPERETSMMSVPRPKKRLRKPSHSNDAK